MTNTFSAGAGSSDITPTDSQFLYGYPHVKRYSTGINDPLLSSALYMSDGRVQVMFIANDIVCLRNDIVTRIRLRISEAVPIPKGNIMITSTHTHSGPITVNHLSTETDTVLPKVDPNYIQFLEDGIVTAGIHAYQHAVPAQLGLAVADSTGIGTNRRDPAGPSDHEVPVLMVRKADGKQNIACMLVCSMHPTVLHEDSTLISGDFPGMSRQFLQENILGKNCPVLHHTGPSGNQSPRHVTRGNTFEEAVRLGCILGKAVAKVIPSIEYSSDVPLHCSQAFLDLPGKEFPSPEKAKTKLEQAVSRLEQLRKSNAPRQETRTAECDWFGAEETLCLARAAHDGRLADVIKSCMPGEVQMIKVGRWCFTGWPAEVFVDYALAVKKVHKNIFIISLANNELQGYIVTPEAVAEGGYEASNGLFRAESGQMLVDQTLRMTTQV